MVLNEYNKQKKQYERDQQTNKSFDKLHRKSLQDILNDKNEYEHLCSNFYKHVDEKKRHLKKNMTKKQY